MEDGTRSILDISRIAPKQDYCVAAPFTADEIRSAVGTDKPSREQVLENLIELIGAIPRGMARYLTLYDNTAKSELFFAGYSFD